MEQQQTKPPEIGLSEDSRMRIVSILSRILADQHVLYIKKRNYHWNLIGGRFHTLHEHFEQLYTELALAIDETAERIRMIGGTAPGSMAEFLSLAELEEAQGGLVDGDSAIQTLLSDHEACVRKLRFAVGEIEESHGDVGTADFLTGLLQKHEMTAWMLRSFLESSS